MLQTKIPCVNYKSVTLPTSNQIAVPLLENIRFVPTTQADSAAPASTSTPAREALINYSISDFVTKVGENSDRFESLRYFRHTDDFHAIDPGLRHILLRNDGSCKSMLRCFLQTLLTTWYRSYFTG